MKRIADFIVKFRFIFLALILAGVAVSIIFIPKVKVNYDLTEYLPSDSATLTALNKMEEQFGAVANAQVMIENIGITEAESIKSAIEDIDGVSLVLLDDSKIVLDGKALYTIFLAESNFSLLTKEVLWEIRDTLSQYELSMSGASVDTTYMQDAISTDVKIILLISIAIIVLILILTSSSWCDVLVFGAVFGVAIIINLGTNAFFNSISFVTQAICIIMQLALAMDYAIMLLHRFNEEKQKEADVKKAVSNAFAKTISPISASSLTTIAGLLALTFMQFKIGFDIGMVLAKGIVCSMLVVFLFMPCLLVLINPLLEKTKHPTLASVMRKKIKAKSEKRRPKAAQTTKNSGGVEGIPPKQKSRKIHSVNGFQWNSRVIVSLIVAALIVGGAILNFMKVDLSYSVSTAKNPSAAINAEHAKIEESFGAQNNLVILVPKGNRENEQKLIDYVSTLEVNGEAAFTKSQGAVTTGLFDTVTTDIIAGFGLPEEFIPEIQKIMAGSMGVSSLESVCVYDLLSFLAESKTAEQIGGIIQEKFDKEYGILFQEVTAAEFGEMAGLNTLLTSVIINPIYTSLGLQPTDKAQAYTIICAINPLLLPAEMKPLAEAISLEEAAGQFKIPEPALLAPAFNGADKIKRGDIIKFIYENSLYSVIYTPVGQQLQRQIDALYGEANGALEIFDGAEYTRLIFKLNMPVLSDESFEMVTALRHSAGIKALYGEDFFIVSESASALDIKSSFTSDNVFITLISALAILVLILITFKSLSIPVLLTLLIQGAIWVTMGVNALFGSSIYFLCYIIITCIQMGATVDYAILLSDRYMNARKTLLPKESMNAAFKAALPTILTSGSILFLAALTVGLVSKLTIISALGLLLARGVAASLICIVFALPQILLLCDKVIQKTTLRKKSDGKKSND